MARRLTRHDYTVGWVAALPLELRAATTMFDGTHGNLADQGSDDTNIYSLGSIQNHNVAMACLPSYGTNSAATVFTNMLRTFPNLRFTLMVGIGGGVPTDDMDIRLGDIVVSKPSNHYGGVVQYDLGRSGPDGHFERTGMLNRPPQILLNCMAKLEANSARCSNEVWGMAQHVLERGANPESKPGPDKDWLFSSAYAHVHLEPTCEVCDKKYLLLRPLRMEPYPQVHYGLIASGNQVVKDAINRDTLAKEIKNLMCFEMEAAGLMNIAPCLVIRGICDYSDSHKNQDWQGYAALNAAAYGSLLLSEIPAQSPEAPQESTTWTEQHVQCIQALVQTNPDDDLNAVKRIKNRVPGTCSWIMETDEMKIWLGAQTPQCPEEPYGSSVLWLYGNPGTGKSTMAVTMAEEIPFSSTFKTGNKILSYFFCDSSIEERRTATSILRGLIYKLVSQAQSLVNYVFKKYRAQKEKTFQSFDSLWSILMDIGEDAATGTKYCIIDALDECDESKAMLLSQISQTFRERGSQCGLTGIKILITSRPYGEIQDFLEGFQMKDLATYNEVNEDLEALIAERVKGLSQIKHYPEAMVDKVTKTLREKAQGTFLYVGIACEELQRVRAKNVYAFLQGLPRGLDSLYHKLLDSALQESDEEQPIMMNILSIVAIARRPLTPLELCDACQLYSTEDKETRCVYIGEDIKTCRLLVIIQGQRVLLLHKSLKDFLLMNEKSRVLHEPSEHAEFAYRCLDYLVKDKADASPSSDGFLEYSVYHWADHAYLSKDKFRVQGRHTLFFERNSPTRARWLALSRLLNRPRSDKYKIPYSFSIFHVAARWGLLRLIEYALQTWPDKSRGGVERGTCSLDLGHLNSFSSDGNTHLSECARQGHFNLFSFILGFLGNAHKVEDAVIRAAAGNHQNGHHFLSRIINHSGRDLQITEEMAIQAAIYGNVQTVQLLFDHGLGQVMNNPRVIKDIAFNIANRMDIMNLLYDRLGESISITNEVINLAIEVGDGEYLTMLFDRAAENVVPTEQFYILATQSGSHGFEVMQTLIRRFGEAIPIPSSVARPLVDGNLFEPLISLLFQWVDDKRAFIQMITDLAPENLQVLEFTGIIPLLSEDISRGIPGTENALSVLKIALASTCWDLVALVLNRLTPREVIENGILKKIARSGNVHAMDLVLRKIENLTLLNEEVVAKAIKNERHGLEVLISIANQLGGGLPVKEELVFHAMNNHGCGLEILKFLIKEFGDKLPITVSTLMSIRLGWNSKQIEAKLLLLLDSVAAKFSRPELFAELVSHCNPDIISKILDDSDIQITEDLIIATTSNSSQGGRILCMFF